MVRPTRPAGKAPADLTQEQLGSYERGFRHASRALPSRPEFAADAEFYSQGYMGTASATAVPSPRSTPHARPTLHTRRPARAACSSSRS
jgi:hypothetical protein